MKIVLTSNVAKVTADLDKAARKQIPYASALALTNVAKDAQAEVRSQLRHTFTIRGAWVSKGIQITTANKKDFPIQAVIGTRDDYMARQAEGGEKRGRTGGNVAVPVGARASNRDITKRSAWPKAILRKRNAFVIQSRNGKAKGQHLVYRRDASRNLSLMYILQRKVNVKPIWPFTQLVDRTVRKTYGWRFGQALAKALSSSK